MAAGWLTMLKALPWTEVMNAAPQVAGGAKKLWDAVARKPSSGDSGPASGSEVDAGASMALRIEQAEGKVDELHNQMLEASKIIATLADQNAHLIAKMEAMRVRVLWLTVATIAASLVAIASAIVAATRA